MGQILLIKNANTVKKHVDDYIGVFESSHVFSDREIEEYTILQIEGIGREEIAAFYEAKRTKTKRVFRSTVANQWTETIEKKDAWQDGSDWKLIENDQETPKYQFSFSNITIKDRIDLANPLTDKVTKLAILNKAISRYNIDPGMGNDNIISISAIAMEK